MNGLGGIYRQMKVVADTSHTLDMVGMIVCNEQMVHLRQVQTIVPEMPLQGAHTYTGIDHQSIVVGIEEIAVSAAPAAKRNEFQHLRMFNLAAKVQSFLETSLSLGVKSTKMAKSHTKKAEG